MVMFNTLLYGFDEKIKFSSKVFEFDEKCGIIYM